MPIPPGPILIATALDAGSDEALRQGIEIARATSRAFVPLHVLPEILRPRPVFPHLQELDRATGDSMRAAALRLYESQVQRALAGAKAPPLRLESGTPHAGILAAAAEAGASLIVVGADSEASGTSLGGVAERVVRHASCPVLVARPLAGGPVLAATDFSDPSLPAIAAGAAEAKRRGVPLGIVHVLDLFIPMTVSVEGYAVSASSEVYDAHRQEAERRLAETAREFPAAAGAKLRVGLASDEILAARAELEADLLVLGTHGRSGLTRFALGSVAESVLRRASCSVLVVRLA